MKKPQLSIAVTPEQITQVDKIFDDIYGTNTPADILRNPNKLRNMGWDLGTQTDIIIAEAKALETKVSDVLKIRLLQNGTFIALCLCDYSFIGHSSSEEFNAFPKINQLALVEYIYNFVATYSKLIKFLRPLPESYYFTIGLKNLFINEKKISLFAHTVKDLDFKFNRQQYAKQAQKDCFNVEIKSVELATNNIGEISFLLVEKIYHFFGYQSIDVPYSKDKKIDIGSIIS